MLRQEINEAMKTAMRAKDDKALKAIRQIMAKVKDQDIAARPSGNMDGINEAQIMAVLQGMIKQRRESIALYKQGNRPDLVEQEEGEIEVIERFLPKQMDETAMKEAIRKTIAETGATSVKDMGKIMGALKQAYAGQMDFSLAGPLVKSLLAG